MALTYAAINIEDYDEIYAMWCSIPGIGLSSVDSVENIHKYLQHNPEQSFLQK